MKKTALCVLASICCYTAASASVFNWAESAGTTISAQNNNSNIFSHNGINATVTVTGSGFTGGSVDRIGNAYKNPGYSRNPAAGDYTWVPADHGLVFNTNFASSSEYITVTISFDQVISGLSFTLYGLEISTPVAYTWNGNSNSLTYGWQNTVSGIEGSYKNDKVYLSPSEDSTNITTDTSVRDGIFYDFTNDTYYGLGDANGNHEGGHGNLSVVASDDLTSISFTFRSGTYLTDAQRANGDSYTADPTAQRFGIGHLTFEGSYGIPGDVIPEPSTYATIIGACVLGLTFVLRRRSIKAKA